MNRIILKHGGSGGLGSIVSVTSRQSWASDSYDLSEVGFKYHMNDLAAAVGLGNLPDLPQPHLARHRQIARWHIARIWIGSQALRCLTIKSDRESSLIGCSPFSSSGAKILFGRLRRVVFH